MAKEKIGIVVSEFNYEITGKMAEAAAKHSKDIGAEIIEVVKVPGAFEIPLAAKLLLKRKDIDAVATLGAVIKGDTGHDAVITHAVAKMLLDLSLEHDKPVSLGIMGPNITWEQSQKRTEDYAKRAIEAAVKMLRLLKKID